MNDNIFLFLKKAEEDIQVGDKLFSEENYRVTISRLCYAMFYIAEALLLSKGLSYSSHKAVISAFGKEFVKTGIFEQKFHKLLIELFKARQDADYEPIVEIY